jgi:hypothetical protein
MAQKRRTGKESRTGKPQRQIQSKRKSRAVSSSRGKPRGKALDLQKRAFQVFAKQVDPLWSSLTSKCREFADGFNKALGAEELHVEAAPATLRVAYPRADAELVFQLDKAERYLQVWMNTDCAASGSCLTDQPAVGLTVNGNELQFVLAGEVISDERLAVRLLTQLTNGTSG